MDALSPIAGNYSKSIALRVDSASTCIVAFHGSPILDSVHRRSDHRKGSAEDPARALDWGDLSPTDEYKELPLPKLENEQPAYRPFAQLAQVMLRRSMNTTTLGTGCQQTASACDASLDAGRRSVGNSSSINMSDHGKLAGSVGRLAVNTLISSVQEQLTDEKDEDLLPSRAAGGDGGGGAENEGEEWSGAADDAWPEDAGGRAWPREVAQSTYEDAVSPNEDLHAKKRRATGFPKSSAAQRAEAGMVKGRKSHSWAKSSAVVAVRTPAQFLSHNLGLTGFGSPSSALVQCVREMVENAMDARARSVTVSLLPRERRAAAAKRTTGTVLGAVHASSQGIGRKRGRANENPGAQGGRGGPRTESWTVQCEDDGCGMAAKNVSSLLGSVFGSTKCKAGTDSAFTAPISPMEVQVHGTFGKYGVGLKAAILYAQRSAQPDDEEVDAETSFCTRAGSIPYARCPLFVLTASSTRTLSADGSIAHATGNAHTKANVPSASRIGVDTATGLPVQVRISVGKEVEAEDQDEQEKEGWASSAGGAASCLDAMHDHDGMGMHGTLLRLTLDGPPVSNAFTNPIPANLPTLECIRVLTSYIARMRLFSAVSTEARALPVVTLGFHGSSSAAFCCSRTHATSQVATSACLSSARPAIPSAVRTSFGTHETLPVAEDPCAAIARLYGVPSSCVASAIVSVPCASQGLPDPSSSSSLPVSANGSLTATVFAVLTPVPMPPRAQSHAHANAGDEESFDHQDPGLDPVARARRRNNRAGIVHVLRFVRGVPLLRNAASCAITAACSVVPQSSDIQPASVAVDWSQYGLTLQPLSSIQSSDFASRVAGPASALLPAPKKGVAGAHAHGARLGRRTALELACYPAAPIPVVLTFDSIHSGETDDFGADFDQGTVCGELDAWECLGSSAGVDSDGAYGATSAYGSVFPYVPFSCLRLIVDVSTSASAGTSGASLTFGDLTKTFITEEEAPVSSETASAAGGTCCGANDPRSHCSHLPIRSAVAQAVCLAMDRLRNALPGPGLAPDPSLAHDAHAPAWSTLGLRGPLTLAPTFSLQRSLLVCVHAPTIAQELCAIAALAGTNSALWKRLQALVTSQRMAREASTVGMGVTWQGHSHAAGSSASGADGFHRGHLNLTDNMMDLDLGLSMDMGMGQVEGIGVGVGSDVFARDDDDDLGLDGHLLHGADDSSPVTVQEDTVQNAGRILTTRLLAFIGRTLRVSDEMRAADAPESDDKGRREKGGSTSNAATTNRADHDGWPENEENEPEPETFEAAWDAFGAAERVKEAVGRLKAGRALVKPKARKGKEGVPVGKARGEVDEWPDEGAGADADGWPLDDIETNHFPMSYAQ